MTRDDGSAAKLRQSGHPDKSILLAYIRRQPLEDRLYIQRHIEHCERCSQQFDEYKRISSTLEAALMQVRHFYPHVTSHVFYNTEEHSHPTRTLTPPHHPHLPHPRPTRRRARPAL